MAEQIKFGDKLFLKGETLILDNGENNAVIKSKNNTIIIDGNLEVSDTFTTVLSETVEIKDNIFVLNSNATGSATINAGLEVERGDDLNVQLLWDETNDHWTVGAQPFHSSSTISASTFTSVSIYLRLRGGRNPRPTRFMLRVSAACGLGPHRSGGYT